MITGQTYEVDVELAELTEHPRNPRVGRDDAVQRSIDLNGWYGAIIVHRQTGHVLAGHTRRRALMAAGQHTAPVIWVDCDDATATTILLADNRTAELALWDEDGLGALLRKIADESDDPDLAMIASGFSADDLKAISEAPPEQAAKPTASERFDATNIREIRLTMTRQVYEPFVVRLEQLRAGWGADDFSGVVRRLLDERLA